MKKVKNNPSRLRPFDQQDRDYFEESKPKTFDKCIEQINSSLRAVIAVTRSEHREEVLNRDPSIFARMGRIQVRDLKVYVNQLMEHLEQIEVKGEWK